jgi:hypothetical protein
MTSVNGPATKGAMVNYLREVDGQKLADMLLKHLHQLIAGPKYGFGVVEAIHGNIRMPINRGRGYKNIRYLLLKAKHIAVTQHAEIRRFSNYEGRVE